MSGRQSTPAQIGKRRQLQRVAAACDLCKRRKVKCDGELPCGYCKRKKCSSTCAFTGSSVRSPAGALRHTPNDAVDTPGERNEAPPQQNDHGDTTQASQSPTISRGDAHEDTAVPLEGRILRDAQGKLIFIGDCAPLSFLQTVRHLLTSEVDPEGLSVQAERDSMIEVARTSLVHQQHAPPTIDFERIETLVKQYNVVTSGLVELFHKDELLRGVSAWADNTASHADDVTAAVFYLVLAIGAQDADEQMAEQYFEHAKELLLRHMCDTMNVSTVQGFALLAVYMLRAFQPNGAYLYFSLAGRAAYAIGIHRTEVNASFGAPIKVVRDRIWKSLRVVDQLISNILGRPPSTSDVDCTVKYTVKRDQNSSDIDVLDASVQIFMIIERVVEEVYSRKRISLRIAEYVSRQLKGWASNWLRGLSDTIFQQARSGQSSERVVGACSTLCSYYYGIMLLTRPFLIYELYDYMGAFLRGRGAQGDHLDKRKYADAALEAADSLVETVQTVINADRMPHRMPLIVPWLFTSALVLVVGVLGHSGLTLENSCKDAIRSLAYFGTVDPHARQYGLIVQSLLEVTTTHVRRRESQLRLKRKQASSDLFGSLPDIQASSPASSQSRPRPTPQPSLLQSTIPSNPSASIPFDWNAYDADFFALPWANENDQGLQDFLQPGTHTLNGSSVADIPLFPVYDHQSGKSFL